MSDKAKITITAIICVTILVAIGLIKGIDGYLYGLGIAVISGLAGLILPSPFHKEIK